MMMHPCAVAWLADYPRALLMELAAEAVAAVAAYPLELEPDPDCLVEYGPNGTLDDTFQYVVEMTPLPLPPKLQRRVLVCPRG